MRRPAIPLMIAAIAAVIILVALFRRGKQEVGTHPGSLHTRPDQRAQLKAGDDTQLVNTEASAVRHGADIDDTGISFRIIDDSSRPLRGVRAYPVSASRWRRMFVDVAPIAKSNEDGVIQVTEGERIVLYRKDLAPLSVDALEDIGDPLVMKYGSTASIRVVDVRGRPMPSFRMYVSRSNVYKSYNTDVTSDIIPVPGHNAIRLAVTDATGLAVLADLPLDYPQTCSTYNIYPTTAAVVYPPASLRGGSTCVVKIGRVKLFDVGGDDLLGAAHVSRPLLTPKPHMPWLSLDGKIGRCGSLPIIDSHLIDGINKFFCLRREKGLCLQTMNSIGELGEERVVRSATSNLNLIVPNGTGLPVTVQMSHEQVNIRFVASAGHELSLPPGQYRIFDPIGRPMVPDVVTLPSSAVQVVAKTPLFRAAVSIECKDGMKPAFPVVHAGGKSWLTAHGRQEWLPFGTIAVSCDHYGRASVHVRPDRPAPSKITFTIQPRHVWYHDAPLGRECAEIAANMNIIMSENALDTERLGELLARTASERAKYDDSGNALARFLERAQMVSRPHRVFRNQDRYHEQMAKLGSSIDIAEGTKVVWSYREVADEKAESWTGYIYRMEVDRELAAHKRELFALAERRRIAKANLDEWLKARAYLLTDIVRNAGVRK